ncbi:MAG: sodium-dependent transporter, partial [Muribaculaceae bacterium]|nr:sodium-dependent transporter [Muribaculaceae bacterium]
VLLPMVSMGVCVYVGWFAPKSLLKTQITNDGTIKSRITSIVLVIIRYLAPVLIAAIMISKFV